MVVLSASLMNATVMMVMIVTSESSRRSRKVVPMMASFSSFLFASSRISMFSKPKVASIRKRLTKLMT